MQRNGNTDKTHCKRGHPLNGENLIQNEKQRVCKKCFAETKKKYYQKTKVLKAEQINLALQCLLR